MTPERVFLLPGEFVISKKPHDVSTLLGSCVAVCLFSPQAGFGGINHYMLPHGRGERSAKYGDYSIETMIRFMERGAGGLDGVQAMVFGGANVVGAIKSGAAIGEQNVEVAHVLLGRHGIPISREETGGLHGMKIHYLTWTNQVEVRPIERSAFAEKVLHKEDKIRNAGIRVLIVDDSPLVCQILAKAVADEPGMIVVGQAHDAFQAREMLLEQEPDVIILDIIMPKMDGLTFLKKLMVYHPIPVIICSTIAKAGGAPHLRAKQIGAVDVIDKETLDLYKGLDQVKKTLIPKIRAAATRPVVKQSKEDLAGI